jgi:hypothetical protein
VDGAVIEVGVPADAVDVGDALGLEVVDAGRTGQGLAVLDEGDDALLFHELLGELPLAGVVGVVVGHEQLDRVTVHAALGVGRLDPQLETVEAGQRPGGSRPAHVGDAADDEGSLHAPTGSRHGRR